jgi:hypothetical protein
MKLRGKLNPHNSLERKLGSHQKRPPFSRPKIDEHIVIEFEVHAFKDCVEPGWLNWDIAISTYPVRTGNVQIAQVSPTIEISIGIYLVVSVEIAAFMDGLRSLYVPVFLKQVYREQKTSAKTHEYAALFKGLPDSWNDRPHDAGHNLQLSSRWVGFQRFRATIISILPATTKRQS